jgi:beta-carotene hydroxylase
MNKPDQLDQQALQAAKQYMGKVAWPTVLLGVAVSTSYVAIPLLVAAGVLSLLVAVPLMAFLTYAAYTVLHMVPSAGVTHPCVGSTRHWVIPWAGS